MNKKYLYFLIGNEIEKELEEGKGTFLKSSDHSKSIAAETLLLNLLKLNITDYCTPVILANDNILEKNEIKEILLNKEYDNNILFYSLNNNYNCYFANADTFIDYNNSIGIVYGLDLPNTITVDKDAKVTIEYDYSIINLIRSKLKECVDNTKKLYLLEDCDSLNDISNEILNDAISYDKKGSYLYYNYTVKFDELPEIKNNVCLKENELFIGTADSYKYFMTPNRQVYFYLIFKEEDKVIFISEEEIPYDIMRLLHLTKETNRDEIRITKVSDGNLLLGCKKFTFNDNFYEEFKKSYSFGSYSFQVEIDDEIYFISNPYVELNDEELLYAKYNGHIDINKSNYILLKNDNDFVGTLTKELTKDVAIFDVTINKSGNHVIEKILSTFPDSSVAFRNIEYFDYLSEKYGFEIDSENGLAIRRL